MHCPGWKRCGLYIKREHLSWKIWPNTFSWVMSCVYSSSTCFAPDGDRVSVEDLWIGVEVSWALLLPLLGVLARGLTDDWPFTTTSFSGGEPVSSVACNEIASEVTFFSGVLWSFLFLVFQDPPEGSFSFTRCINEHIFTDFRQHSEN